ncbi:hypothetical protein EDB80DRAFT_729126 [Ilyonectria destructans]|nr:hypothetical protein EDB80DRAFT_729126 [Ilyonectria destructans]
MRDTCLNCTNVEQLYACSQCNLKLCHICIEFHHSRSGHEPEVDSKEHKAVKWMLGKVGKWVELTKEKLFQQDESTKWFGIWRDSKDSLLWLIETPRFEHLLLESRNRSGCIRTFPRLVAFVGQTGVGKSTIGKSQPTNIYSVQGKSLA